MYCTGNREPKANSTVFSILAYTQIIFKYKLTDKILATHLKCIKLFWSGRLSQIQLENYHNTSLKVWKIQQNSEPESVCSFFFNIFYFICLFIFLICSEFCHTLKWNSLELTCLPHPDPPSHLPLHPLPPGLPRAPGPSACLMHPIWAGDLFHPW